MSDLFVNHSVIIQILKNIIANINLFDKATFIRTRVNHLFTYPQYWSSNLYRASSITIIYQIIGSAIDAADCLIAIELADRLSDCSAGNHFRLTTI